MKKLVLILALLVLPSNVYAKTYAETTVATSATTADFLGMYKDGVWSKLQFSGNSVDMLRGDGTFATGSDLIYDSELWNSNTDVPTKNAVRDKIESLSFSSTGLTKDDIESLTTLDLSNVDVTLHSDNTIDSELATQEAFEANFFTLPSGGTAMMTEQAGVPSASSAVGLYYDTTSHIAYYKSAAGLQPFTMGTYVADPVTTACSGDFSTGDNESFENATDGEVCTTDFIAAVDTSSIMDTVSTTQFNSGAKSLEVAMSVVTDRAYASWDIGVADGDFSVRFYVRTPSDLLTTNVGSHPIVFSANEYGASSGSRLKIYMGSTGIFGESSGVSTPIVVAAATWYRVEVDYNSGGTGTVAVYTTGGVEVGSESLTCQSSDLRYFDVGQIRETSTANAVTYYIDDFKYQAAGGVVGGI